MIKYAVKSYKPLLNINLSQLFMNVLRMNANVMSYAE